MERARLNHLILALLDGSIDKKEYKELRNYLRKVISGVAEKLRHQLYKSGNDVPYNILQTIDRMLPAGEEAGNFVTDEFIIHLISKKASLYSILGEEGGNLRGYIAIMVRNFIVDMYRKAIRSPETINLSSERTEEKKEELYPMGEEDLKRQIFLYELIEVESLVEATIGKDGLKYLCYMKNSRRYKCLWGKKNNDAIYQDVRRNHPKVLDSLRKVLEEHNISRELFEEFNRTKLSDMCEKLRSERCKEGRNETP